MERRQFLGAAATLATLPASSTPVEATHEGPPDESGPSPLIDGLYMRMHREGALDEGASIDLTAGETWDGTEHRPTVDLRLNFWNGEMSVTLFGDQARELAHSLFEKSAEYDPDFEYIGAPDPEGEQ